MRSEYKIIFLGDSGVGKTALKDAYCNGFSYNTVQTIGLEFYTKQITRNSETFKIKIWDTAGQERYRAIPRPYYRNCDAAFLVYDITNRKTFEHIPDWIKEVRTFSNLPQNRQPKILIIGNKADMEFQREVSQKELQHLAKAYNCSFNETSATNIQSVILTFDNVIDNINFEDLCRQEEEEIIINLDAKPKKSKSNCNC